MFSSLSKLLLINNETSGKEIMSSSIFIAQNELND